MQSHYCKNCAIKILIIYRHYGHDRLVDYKRLLLLLVDIKSFKCFLLHTCFEECISEADYPISILLKY